jgi:uncharacterized SAM-binding protein YcdF (DUF218 family)
LPLIFTVAMSVIHLTPLVPWLAGQWTEWGPEPKRGVLIVLGGEQLSDGTIGLMSYWRCVYAAGLYRHGEFSKVLVSGGVGGEGGAQAPRLGAAMRQALEAMGVPGDRIVVEDQSSSTHTNAQNAARLLGERAADDGPFTLVTSDFHTYRAAACFRRAGLAVSCWPVPDVLKRSLDWTQRLSCARALAEEGVKIIYYRWQGWL